MIRLIAATHRATAFLLAGLCATAANVHALDPPHNGQNSLYLAMSCEACHYTTSGPTPSWATQQTTTDSTFFNNLCTSCHKPTSMTESRFVVKTHSSGNTSNKYGNWTIECRICHNPHYQDQVSMYPYDASADLLSGTTGPFVQPPLSALETTVPIVGGGLVANAWIDHTFVPNTAYAGRMYRIKSNTADAVTVYGPVNGRYAAAGSHFAIRLGKLVLGQVPTPYTGKKQVKFFRESGARSFATSTDPADMTSICQVCHENTTSFNSRGDLEGPGHPSLQAGGNCTQCHTHISGFKPACGSCHGNPPIVSTQGGPNGLANNEGGTGSTTPGAHGKHAISAGIACDACHENGMPATTIYDKLIQIGFNIANGLYKTGSYDGRATLANGYTYTRGNAGTTITQAGTKVCSNIYCHGSTLSGGTATTPVWDGSVACGDCHYANFPISVVSPPSGRSHMRHTGSLTRQQGMVCSDCHGANGAGGPGHVDATVQWALNTAKAGTDAKYRGAATGIVNNPAPSAAYGQCSTVYCHSTVQPNGGSGAPDQYFSPTWGDAAVASCEACHKAAAGDNHGSYTSIASGAHGKHLDYAFTTDRSRICTICHVWNPGAMLADSCTFLCHARTWSRHANGSVDVAFIRDFNLNGSATYSGTPAPGDGYGTCSNIYCHGLYSGSGRSAAPQWGDAQSGACGTCHGASNNDVPRSGSHERHASTSNRYGGSTKWTYAKSLSCTLCHNGIVSGSGPANYAVADKALHVNGKVNWKFDAADPKITPAASYSIATGSAAPSDGAARAYGRCSNVYCHSIVQTATGGPLTPGLSDYGTPTWGSVSYCGNSCHNEINSHGVGGGLLTSGSHTKHFSYTFNVGGQVRKCTLCHKWNTSRPFNDCNQCHDAVIGETGERTYHLNGVVDVRIDAYFGTLASWNGTPVPGDGFGGSTCSNTYCHGNGTSVATGTVPANVSPPWGSGTLGCTGCHGDPPSYANGAPKANSHPQHAVHSIGCGDCHAVTTSDGTTIASAVNHVNKAYDVSAGASRAFTYSYTLSGGTCITISCHNNGSATWGAFACDSCHDCPPPTGSHVKHFGTAAMYNAVYGDTRIAQDISGSIDSYIMNCGNCHPVDAAKHYNGTVEVELYSALSPSGSLKSRNSPSAEYIAGGTLFTDGRGFPYTQGTCQNIYCHSYNDWTTPGGVPESTDCTSYLPPNLVTTRYYRTATWGSSALTCSGCHGNAPRTDYPANDGGSGDSHFWVDSYGYGNLHNWNMGYAPISCSYCHNETIRTQNTWTRDAMDVATQSDVPIYNYAKHVNGIVDVAFDKLNTFPYSTPYNLTTASYDNSTKTCSNVSCHQSQINVIWGTPYRWESAIECDRCHNMGGICP